MCILYMFSKISSSLRNSQLRGNAIFSEKIGGNEKVSVGKVSATEIGQGIPSLRTPYLL